MSRRILVVLFLISVFSTGCESTFAVFNKPPPEHYVEVISEDSDESVEASLKKSGVNYICREIYYGKGSSKNRRACFVKAPPVSMYEALGVKINELPSAILKDTGTNAIIAGNIAVALIMCGVYVP